MKRKKPTKAELVQAIRASEDYHWQWYKWYDEKSKEGDRDAHRYKDLAQEQRNKWDVSHTLLTITEGNQDLLALVLDYPLPLSQCVSGGFFGIHHQPTKLVGERW